MADKDEANTKQNLIAKLRANGYGYDVVIVNQPT